MAKDVLNLLERNRPLIILTEVVGFLHDLGKLDNECYRKHNERIRTEFSKNVIPPIIFTLFRNAKLKEVLHRVVSDEMLIFLSEGKNKPEVFSPIFWHHFDRPQFNPRNNFEKLIADADSQDSKEDRGAQEERTLEKFYIATPFGFEELLDENIKDKLNKFGVKDRTGCRLKFYQEFAEIISRITYEKNGEIKFKGDKNSWKEFRNEFYEIVEKYFPLSLAETRRPSNDINLYDHCYMTGSISKVGIVGFILTEKLRNEFKEAISRSREYKFKFRLLVVGFDGYGFLTKVNRLPDFIGRFEKLERMREKIREIVEFEIPIGNLVYEDLSMMCFLIPDLAYLEDGDEIINEIRKRVTSVIVNDTNGLVVPFIDVYGKENGESSEYIGPLIKNANIDVRKKVTSPYSGDFELINTLPWIKDWENRWMCFDCQSLFTVPEDNKCPKCSSKRIKQREKCYVCGYAPEYPIPEGIVSTKGERLCKYCRNLRHEGIKRRLNREETVWLDQIRDENNLIALIVGKIWPVEKWLNGDYIKKTTFTVFANPKENKKNKLNQVKGILRTKGRNYKLYEDVRKIVEHNSEALWYFNSGIEQLLKENISPDDSRVEIFIEELIKLLSEKSASPSRLRRVWKEFEEFSDKSIEIAKKFFEDKKRKQLILKVDKELKEVRTLGKSELGTVISEKKEIITIDYLDCIKDDKKLDELSEEKIKKLLLKKKIEVEWEDGKKEIYKIEDVKVRYFIPIVPIYRTAGEFMFLCPAKYALAIITRIKAYFFKRFNKALGKLSLNLGLIYFKYKQPLYLVLDAGRRLLKEFESEVLREMDEEKSYEIKRNGDIFIVDELRWNVVPKFDDGSEDWYYCTIRDSTGEYRPILEINNGRIQVHHNFFDYEYLESTQKRFDIILESSKRPHPILKKTGPRPYLLEELGRIIKLWEILNPENGKLTKTKIMKIMHICSNKIEDWEEDGLVKEFIKSTVENSAKLKNEEKDFLIKSINDGSFFDTIELFIKLEQELSPFDVISFFIDFQYNKEERMMAEKWLLSQGGGINADS